MPSLLILTPVALAGYGDVVDGRPTWAQRELHTYTNMVRVEPTAWDYACSTQSFSSSEKTAKAPLLYHDGLTEIAQIHSEDMERGRFMSHSSSDGTPFDSRVWPYYEGNTIGENVAYGYSDNEAALFDGWMCSSGHRANIMSGSFEDLGVGVAGVYYTQDFGGGADLPRQPVAMGVHTPRQPRGEAVFYATWDDQDAPASLQVETDDACVDMERIAGTSARGAWSAALEMSDSVDPDAGGCAAYRFIYTTADGATGALPEDGAWMIGDGCGEWTDAPPAGCSETEETDEDDASEDCGELDFEDRNGDCLPDPDMDTELESGGCQSVGGFAGGAGWLALIGLGLVRRRT